MKWDGTTGLPYPAYTPSGDFVGIGGLVGIHPDGTVFATQCYYGPGQHGCAVVGIDPTTGTQKFDVPIRIPPDSEAVAGGNAIIAGDGYAYVPYGYRAQGGDTLNHLRLLRVSASGAYDDFQIADVRSSQWSEVFSIGTYIITNNDTGILLSWGTTWNGDDPPVLGMAITNGTNVTLINAPQIPGQSDAIIPMLQAQDGSFVGTVWAGSEDDPLQYMIAFDQTGAVRWAMPNEQPQIATAEGGVIGQSGVVYDQNGNTTAQIVAMPVQSWTGNLYRYGSVDQFVGMPILLAASFWAFQGANNSGNYAAAQALPDRVKATYDLVGPDPLGAGSVLRNITYELFQGTYRYPGSKNAVIKEVLLYSYGQKPQPSESNPGEAFEDEYGTRGKGSFGETQQFLIRLPGYRSYRVRIEPCTDGNAFGNPTWQNIVNATDQTVLINQDTGSTQARTCRPQ